MLNHTLGLQSETSTPLPLGPTISLSGFLRVDYRPTTSPDPDGSSIPDQKKTIKQKVKERVHGVCKKINLEIKI